MLSSIRLLSGPTSRFTVRYMTAYIAEQPELLGPDRISKYGFWSWEDVVHLADTFYTRVIRKR